MLVIGDSLCAGASGEYALRFSSKKLDTLLTLEYKRKRQWSIGLKNQVVSNATLQIGTNGTAIINGAGPRLPYQLFAKTVVNASYMELQDNGIVRIASDNGTTGWKKSPVPTFEERRNYDYAGHDIVYYQGWSLLSCLDNCESAASCLMALYNEMNDFTGSVCTRGTPCCVHKNAVPWGSSLNNTYYEKISGCASGASCYKQVNSTENVGFDVTAYTTETSPNACSQRCDAEPRCTNFVFSSGNSRCYLKWLRINESISSVPMDAYVLAQRNRSGYKVYRGCFIDAATRHLDFQAYGSTFNSKTLCTSVCASMNYLFAGMEFDVCFCGNAVGLYAQVAESDCSFACNGNRQESCGSNWRINIYETGLQDPAGSATSPVIPVYKGCYIDAAVHHLSYIAYFGYGFNNKMACANTCEGLRYVYAGMEGDYCFCGNWVGLYAQVTDTDCNTTCPGSGNGAEKCGGSLRLSIYSTGQPAPTDPDASTLLSYVYKGCFVDAEARDLPFFASYSGGLSAIRCIQTCSRLKYIYAGLEFDACFCGNIVGHYGQVADTDCSFSCSGAASEKCGSNWRLTVYETTQLAPTDPAAVVVPNECPSQLLVNHQLLPGERICSPNGKHVLVAETDGRVTVDGMQLSVGAASGQTAYLQLTDTFQFLLRLTDTTVKWRIDSSPRAQCSSPVGYLIVSDNGVVQVRNNRDLVIWDSAATRWPMELGVQPLLESDRAKANMLIDFDNSTCLPNGTIASFSFCDFSMNFTVSITLVGQNLQCAKGGGYQFVMMRSAAETGVFPGGRSRPCQLVTANQSACSFECRCELPICNKVVLLRRGCSIEPSQYCEVIVR